MITYDINAIAEKVHKAILAGRTAEIVKWARAKGIHAFDQRGGGMQLMTADQAMAFDDVQSPTITTASGGIPWFLANWFDPKLIPIIFAPMMAAVIAGEAMKGDWLTATAMFATIEPTGEVASYGDYSQAGSTTVNANFPQRQNYLFQSFLQFGQMEVGRMGLAKIDWAAKQQESNAFTLNKALNNVYFYGVSGLQNYGLINDPYLPPALTATYSWLNSSSATAATIYQDIVRMYIQLQAQSDGVIRMDSRMVLAMSPKQSAALMAITPYNTMTVKGLLEQYFPNLRLETAPEFGTPYNSSGELVFLICEEIDGQRTVECAFSTKLMAGNMVVDTSSWRQKRWSGGYGAVWYRRFAMVQMLA
jgi:hypothetical protein